jgi:hypothetical protein
MQKTDIRYILSKGDQLSSLPKQKIKNDKEIVDIEQARKIVAEKNKTEEVKVNAYGIVKKPK